MVGKRIAIIGGGWAGLACAVELAKWSGPAPDVIRLFEAAPQFGGRARGLHWRGHEIDNGQHLAIGAYTKTIALLETVNAPPWHQEPLRWAGVSHGARLAQDWEVPDNGWPWRMLRAAGLGKGPRGWPVQWRWSVAMRIGELYSKQWRLPREPVLQWLHRTNTPQSLIAHFWQPLVEGALNTPIAHACAQTAARVLKDSLAGPAGATSVLAPKTNLSIDGVDPICAWLKQQGVGLQLGQRAMSLVPKDDGTVAVRLQSGTSMIEEHFDRVVMALPYQASLSLWDQSSLARTKAIERLGQLQESAITTVWVELSEQAKRALHRLPNWFVLNQLNNTPHIAQVAVIRSEVLALVISAQLSCDDRISKESHQATLREQLMTQLGIDLSSLAQKWVTEKQATWACTPQSPIACEEDAQGLTGVQHIFRCADDLEPGYPATIESAVRSGVRCAQSVRASLDAFRQAHEA